MPASSGDTRLSGAQTFGDVHYIIAVGIFTEASIDHDLFASSGDGVFNRGASRVVPLSILTQEFPRLYLAADAFSVSSWASIRSVTIFSIQA